MLKKHIEHWSGQMNKILLLLMMIALSLNALEWKSYKEALKIQKQNSKIIMIDVIRTNCRYCSDMERDVFKDEDMSAWLDERFIPVKVNIDTDTLPLGLKVSFTPSFFFVNKDSIIVKKVPGSWNIEDFKLLTKDIK